MQPPKTHFLTFSKVQKTNLWRKKVRPKSCKSHIVRRGWRWYCIKINIQISVQPRKKIIIAKRQKYILVGMFHANLQKKEKIVVNGLRRHLTLTVDPDTT